MVDLCSSKAGYDTMTYVDHAGFGSLELWVME